MGPAFTQKERKPPRELSRPHIHPTMKPHVSHRHSLDIQHYINVDASRSIFKTLRSYTRLRRLESLSWLDWFTLIAAFR